MRLLLALVVCLSYTLAQDEDIDQGTIDFIFTSPKTPGTPTVTTTSTTTTTTTTTPGYELGDITVKPTSSPTSLLNKNGKKCQCVPYYQCDKNDVAIGKYDPDSGYNLLDVRFGDNECQESIEKCCVDPLPPEKVPKPKPNATNLKGCGFRNPNGLGITGGTGAEARFGEFPWVVALVKPSDDTLVGVGAIIHPQVVLTAAHVVDNFDTSSLKVRAGEWDTQTTKEIRDHQERNIQEIIIHSGFRPKNLYNDIAILHLNKKLDLDEHINMICLPNQDEVFDTSKNCIANGWGKDRFGVKGRYAVFLKKVELDMVEHSYCNTLFQRTRLGSRFNLHSSFVCAGGEAGKDTCTGDGGAPLACPIGNDRFKLTGLVSWGIECGHQDVPGAYTAVPAFRSWVDEKMKSLGYGTSTYAI